MYVDDPMILELVALLKAHRLRHVVISPGSRHYPIVRSLESDGSFLLYSVVDERSAGFFALGLLGAVCAPVAVLSTSGTAAVNFGSAVAEAYYQGLPLLVMTADRLPELLGQLEDQMVDQQSLFLGMTKFKGQLTPGESPLQRWNTNRVVNEGLLALTRDGGGPVHLNIPVGKHSRLTYDVGALPDARVIRRHSATNGEIDWQSLAARLVGQRVMVLWGQSSSTHEELRLAFDAFAERVDVVVLADHLGNFHHERAASRPYELLMSGSSLTALPPPQVVISVGGTMFLLDRLKAFLRGKDVEHWRVHPDGEIADPFWLLSDVIQTSAREFFVQVSSSIPVTGSGTYAQKVRSLAEALPSAAPGFGELAVITRFLELVPGGSALHIANSAPMRMAHLSRLPSGITVLGNRGVNGIDGSMSSAIGYATATSAPVFLVIGDLSFFYDLNSLWIRNTPSNLRILLVNNGGGALMHAPLTPARAAEAAVHISAGHAASARGWVESRGIAYRAASDDAQFSAALSEFVDLSADGPIVLEVFTEKIADIEDLQSHSRNLASGATPQLSYRRARSLVGKALRRAGLRH